MSQKDFCKRIGRTPTHVSQIFNCKRRASVDLQEKMSQEFGLHAEDVVRVGRMILEGKGFFPFIGQIEDLPANSEAQARKIVKMTNRAFGVEGHLLSYRPALWDEFVAGKISASQFYDGYSKELQELINAIRAS